MPNPPSKHTCGGAGLKRRRHTAEMASRLPLLVAFVRRRWRTILLSSAAVTAVAATYVATATPFYTATTTVLIDSQPPHPFRQEQSIVDQQAESAFVES